MNLIRSLDIVKKNKVKIDKSPESFVVISTDVPKKPIKKRRFRLVHINYSLAFIGISFAAFGALISYRQDLVLKASLAKFATKPGKYLVIFQNDAEIRPSGGFIGSYATLDWNVGIKDLKFGTNIYKLDNSFEKATYVEAPEPLKKHMNINEWGMRDSNWALDFRDAAKSVSWFYEKEVEQKTDGVIAINTQAVINLLKITGPINMTKYNLTLDSGNFRQIVQEEVEKKYFEDENNKILNEPKTILADLIPLLEERIKETSKVNLYHYITNQLYQKNILLYSEDNTIQESINQYNWGGAIRASTYDYLYINRASLGGGKSSKNVIENISYKIDSNSEANLIITRTHTGDGTWPDSKNSTYYRVVVPENSNLISINVDGIDFAGQVDITNEYNRKVVGFKVDLDPGRSQAITINYNLPFDINNNYSLLLQKQPGAPFESYSINVLGNTLFNGTLDSDYEIKM